MFRGVNRNYRVCWIKKDPLRDSYWSDLYEVTSAGKAIFAAATSIPSTLREPDPRKIHGWDHRSGASSAPADSEKRGM